MLRYLLISLLIFSRVSFAQTSNQLDTNRLYIKIQSDLAIKNPAILIYNYVPLYIQGAPTIYFTNVPLNYETWFPLNCYTNNPVQLFTDFAFKGERTSRKIPGNFYSGDSVLVNIDAESVQIIK